MESWVIFKQYCGTGFLPILFLICEIYLLIKEKETWKRCILVYTPLLIFVAFFVPITRQVFVAVMDEGATYYRLLWLLPMGVVIAYTACKAATRHPRVGLVIAAVVVILCGDYVYDNPNITKAENAYHIPQTVVEICDLIAPADGQPRIRAAFPSELVYFVRQYNTNIMMPFGREMVETQWDYYNPVYEVMEKPETICAQDLLEATRETKCSYIILATQRSIDEDLENLGVEKIATIGLYDIYADPVIIEAK